METGATLFLEEKFQRGQEQSYSSLYSLQSFAWDHFPGDIDDPCGVITDFCRVIADP